MKQRSQVVALCIVMTTALLVIAPFQPPIASASPGLDDPRFIRLTYQHSPTSSITVSWQTVYSSGDTVLYDTISQSGDPSKYSLTALGSHHTYAGASGYVHDVEISGLTPDTTYYFVCGGSGNYSAERSFRTAPTNISEFSFVIGGDSRGTATTEPTMRSQVSLAMNKFNPSFVLHVGDMVYDGNNQATWDTWFADIDSNWIGTNGLTIPVIPTLGNHENNATKYYEQFALLGNEQWYYYDWGPTLRIIVLNSAATSSQISVDQANWLESVLSSTPEHVWKIVLFHNNVYYAGGHTDERNLRQYWVPIFDKYHADLVVQGHEHLYHRTKPLNNTTLAPSYREGTVYLTAGAWGAPLLTYSQQWYSAYGLSVYHFVLATVYLNGSLHFEAKGTDGKTFDQFWLHTPLKYWDFSNGVYVRVQNANITQPPILTNENLTLSIEAPTGTNSTTEVYCANRGPPLATSGIPSWRYDNSTKILTATTIHGSQPTTILLSWSNQSASDDVPPAAIVDLTANNPTVDSITLTWTAPGDDGTTGTASGYIVKYSTIEPITESNWNSATNYTQSWTPLAAGSTEIHMISGLAANTTYWFAVKAYDEVPNTGGVSNSPSGRTIGASSTTPPALAGILTGVAIITVLALVLHRHRSALSSV